MTAAHDATDRTLPTALDEAAAATPDKTVIWWEDDQQSYRELRSATRAAAAGLRRAGLQRGERFAIYLSNCPEFIHAWLGGLYTGVQPVGINLALRGELLRHQVVNSRSRLIVTSPEHAKHVLAVLPDCPQVQTLVIVGDTGDITADVEVVSAEDLFIGDIDEPSADLSVDDVAAILYTSGTTGWSKGVVMTHGYLANVSRAIGAEVGLTADVTTYTCLPLFHLGGLRGVMDAIWFGGTTVYEYSFSPRKLIRRIHERGIRGCTLVAPMLPMIWNLPPEPEDAALPLEYFLVGEVLVPVADVKARYNLDYLLTIFGQTEVFPVSLGRAGEVPDGSSGRVSPLMDVRIVDDEGNEVPVGGTGEIVIRGKVPHVMCDGYLDDSDANAKVFRDGWFHSGDIGKLDADGHLFWVDRKKDALRRRGENISSVEIEIAIRAHAAVRDVAIHGVPGGELGDDDVKAVIELHADASVTHEELNEYFTEQIPKYAVPRFIEFVDELPRNPIGKILKGPLRERGVTPQTWDRSSLSTTGAPCSSA